MVKCLYNTSPEGAECETQQVRDAGLPAAKANTLAGACSSRIKTSLHAAPRAGKLFFLFNVPQYHRFRWHKGDHCVALPSVFLFPTFLLLKFEAVSIKKERHCQGKEFTFRPPTWAVKKKSL